MAEPHTAELNATDAAATLALGARLARALRNDGSREALVVHLRGELGVGKTTLVRGALRELGVAGTIRSPTFSLLETYDFDGRVAAHLDLYRLSGDDVEGLGVRDLLTPGNVLFVEWPERAARALPEPDVAVLLEYSEQGRRVRIDACSEAGRRLVQEWLR
jgi:tRNA threonylcarbamoyladenosine biosynthesis protein TsaE